jgi:hypothetical protein
MVDNACREFLFVSEFFILDSASAQEIFNNIFGKTVQLLLKHTDSYAGDSYDCISLFLCIHLVQRYQLLCHKRCVEEMEMAEKEGK